MKNSPKSKDIRTDLDTFLRELSSYQYLQERQMKGEQLDLDELRLVSELRITLLRKVGEFRQLITELTHKDEDTIYEFGKPRLVDIWHTGLTQDLDYRAKQTLSTCIDITNEAIGRLKTDIEQGIRDVQGNLIEETRSIDARESPKTYENIGGRIVGNEFEVALQGTVDMAIECIMHFTKKLNSQGHSYKSSPRIGGHPDYAKPDRTCFATCTITEITEGTENQIGTIEFQLLPNERTLLKTSTPQEWNSSFKYFMDALFAEFEQLRYIKEEKTAIISGSPPKAFIAKANWNDIENEFGITKKAFGRAINFVSDKFRRNIIFRDVEHAFLLASTGFSKPAVILAGGVIEELLRLYLEHKNISPISNNFDGYIKTCEQKGFLKSGISRLSDSVRYFRNLVHLSKEETKRYTISKSTAKGAVASIFTIANDF